jgi:hypothetical protein
VIPVVVAIPEIPVPVVVPAVFVAKAAAIPLPVTLVESLSVVSRQNPDGAGIGRASPVTVMPHVTASRRIPIAVYP